MIRYLLFLFAVLPSLIFAAEEYPPKGFTEIDSVESSYGGFSVVHYQKDSQDDSDDTQIWVHAIKPEFKTQLLFTHNSSSHTLISDDENYIAINLHECSNLNNLLVFKRNEKGGFDEVNKDFREAVQNQMIKQYKLEKDLKFGHEYCYADVWMRDGLLLGHLSGEYSGGYSVEPWYFIYDVRRDRFVWDLTKINKRPYSEKEQEKPTPPKKSTPKKSKS